MEVVWLARLSINIEVPLLFIPLQKYYEKTACDDLCVIHYVRVQNFLLLFLYIWSCENRSCEHMYTSTRSNTSVG
jgi:hypothetical protein